MKVHEVTAEHATVDLSAEDVRMLNNALNEVCNGIDFAEFEVRLGFSRSEVTEALGELRRLLVRMSPA